MTTADVLFLIVRIAFIVALAFFMYRTWPNT